MTDSKPQFSNFKDAYCAAHECAADRFESKVFWRCLRRHALPVAGLLRLRYPDFFQADFEAISAIGRAISEGELQVLVAEFENLRLVERGLLHATFQIRLSSVRLMQAFQELVPLLRPPEAVPVAVKMALPARATAAVSVSREVADSSLMTVRCLKRLHAEVVTGRNLERATAEVGLEPAKIRDLLARHREGRPELAWLDEYLRQQQTWTELQRENERLARLVTDLSAKLLAASGGI